MVKAIEDACSGVAVSGGFSQRAFQATLGGARFARPGALPGAPAPGHGSTGRISSFFEQYAFLNHDLSANVPRSNLILTESERDRLATNVNLKSLNSDGGTTYP